MQVDWASLEFGQKFPQSIDEKYDWKIMKCRARQKCVDGQIFKKSMGKNVLSHWDWIVKLHSRHSSPIFHEKR